MRTLLRIQRWQGRGSDRILGMWAPVPSGFPSRCLAGQQELFDELTTFPFGAHDDLLDAAATGAAYLLDQPDPRVW